MADTGQSYRIGEGYDCCVEGEPQGKWGMYSFALYERLKANAPEFEQVADVSSRRMAISECGARRATEIPRALRGEYVTGNYFSTLGIRSFAGRLFSEADDRAAAAPVAVLSYRAWKGTMEAIRQYSVRVLSSKAIRSRSSASRRRAFFGETLRGDPPDLWMPLQQEALISGQGSLLRLRVQLGCG